MATLINNWGIWCSKHILILLQIKILQQVEMRSPAEHSTEISLGSTVGIAMLQDFSVTTKHVILWRILYYQSLPLDTIQTSSIHLPSSQPILLTSFLIVSPHYSLFLKVTIFQNMSPPKFYTYLSYLSEYVHSIVTRWTSLSWKY